jgi:hypothetical protein
MGPMEHGMQKQQQVRDGSNGSKPTGRPPLPAVLAVEALENLAATASYLKHLLLVRDLRKIAK